MMFHQHCEESLKLFGAPYPNVHIWLDEFMGKPGIGMRHRRIRHHLAGIAEVQKQWRDEAAKVAMQHIKSDLAMEGWKETDHFPKDEADYVKMGLF